MSWRFSITSFSPWEIVNCDIAYTSELISTFRYPVAVVISDCLSKLLPSPFCHVDDAGMVEWWHWSWTVHRLWILPVSDAMRAELESKWMKLVWKCKYSRSSPSWSRRQHSDFRYLKSNTYLKRLTMDACSLHSWNFDHILGGAHQRCY